MSVAEGEAKNGQIDNMDKTDKTKCVSMVKKLKKLDFMKHYNCQKKFEIHWCLNITIKMEIKFGKMSNHVEKQKECNRKK